MKLLEQYFKAKDGAELISTEGGFLSYLIIGKQFYICDFFIGEDYQGSKENFRAIIGRAHQLGLEKGCEFFACHVPLNIKGLNEVISVRLKFGFRLTGQIDIDRLVMVLPFSEFKERWAIQ